MDVRQTVGQPIGQAIGVVRRAAVRTEKVIGTVVLSHQERAAPPEHLLLSDGSQVILTHNARKALLSGDALALDDERLLHIEAALEALLAVHAEQPVRLLRLACLLGNRHVPVECAADQLFLPDTPAHAELIRSAGCHSRAILRPFQPDTVAAHHHDHHHDHTHDHHHHGCCHDHD
jgi:urease accessory protein